MSRYRGGDEPVPGYRLAEFLGRGSYGEVWKAIGPGRTEVALKFISLDSKQGIKEFKSIGLVKRLRHPNLVPIHAIWLRDPAGNVISDAPIGGDTAETESVRIKLGGPKELVIAMGLGDMSLAQRAEEVRARGGIPVRQLIKYLDGAARGIDYLNEPAHPPGNIPIIHCDIKPANLLIVGGEVQVGDYGVARTLRTDVKKTGGGATPAYAAPELINNDPSPQSDQYSLAITYFELRTGRLPFDEVKALVANLTGSLDLSALEPDERAVIRRATSPQPGKRYPTAEEMIEELKVACGITLTRSAAVGWPAERREIAAPPPPPIAPPADAEPARDTPAVSLDTVVFPALGSQAPPATTKAAPRPEVSTWAKDEEPAAAPARPRRWVWPAIGGVLLVGGAVGVYLATRPGPKPEQTPPPVTQNTSSATTDPKASVHTPPGPVAKPGQTPAASGANRVAPTPTDPVAELEKLPVDEVTDLEAFRKAVDALLRSHPEVRAEVAKLVRAKLGESEKQFPSMAVVTDPRPYTSDRAAKADAWFKAADQLAETAGLGKTDSLRVGFAHQLVLTGWCQPLSVGWDQLPERLEDLTIRLGRPLDALGSEAHLRLVAIEAAVAEPERKPALYEQARKLAGTLPGKLRYQFVYRPLLAGEPRCVKVGVGNKPIAKLLAGVAVDLAREKDPGAVTELTKGRAAAAGQLLKRAAGYDPGVASKAAEGCVELPADARGYVRYLIWNGPDASESERKSAGQDTTDLYEQAFRENPTHEEAGRWQFFIGAVRYVTAMERKSLLGPAGKGKDDPTLRQRVADEYAAAFDHWQKAYLLAARPVPNRDEFVLGQFKTNRETGLYSTLMQTFNDTAKTAAPGREHAWKAAEAEAGYMASKMDTDDRNRLKDAAKEARRQKLGGEADRMEKLAELPPFEELLKPR
jgi:serine/threonine protein kinase